MAWLLQVEREWAEDRAWMLVHIDNNKDITPLCGILPLTPSESIKLEPSSNKSDASARAGRIDCCCQRPLTPSTQP